MKRMTKAALLLCAAAALIVGYVLIGKGGDREADLQQNVSYALVRRAASEIASMSWEKDGESFRFVRGDAGWTDAAVPDLPANGEALDDIAGELAAMTATRRIENAKEASVYGIGEDSFRVTVEWDDGTKSEYAQGTSTPMDDGTYASSSDDPGAVYIVDAELTDVFGASRTLLTAMEKIAVPEETARLRVANTLDITRDTERVSLDPQRCWYDTATGRALLTAPAQNAADTAKALGWKSVAGILAADEDGSAYGLSDGAKRIELFGSDGSSCAVEIGDENDEGDRWARLPGSRIVYTLDGETVKNLFELTPAGMVDTRLAPAPEENVTLLAFSAPSGEWTVSFGTKEDGSAIAAVNGEEADVHKANALRDKFLAFTFTSFADGEEKGEKLLSVALDDARGAGGTFTFYDRNADEYLCECPDGTCVTVPADGVDALLRALRNL